MPLQPGVKLGSFEVLGPLGEGGMGEVYRALDTHLGREVAIKVLPAAFAADPERSARFGREARLLATINHPAIAAVYGAEHFDGVPCIIMELVPGQTLAEILARGPLAMAEALELAGQLADALEAAHERGVIHRDLKPSNIKVTPDGKVKVLDLGLAKAIEPVSSPDEPSRSTTVSLGETTPGVVLGTIAFMSPEQARGKPVDKRTDIWAFGCILYEMLTGRRAFTGDNTADVFTAILSAEPDWSALPPKTPDRLRELLALCLRKDARQRLRDIGDARTEIDRILAGDSKVSAVVTPHPEPKKRSWVPILLAAAVVVAGAAWLWLRPRPPAASGKTGDRSLVVMPAKIASDVSGGQVLGDGLVETLSVRLTKVPGIQVVTPVAAVAASDKDSDPFGAAKRVGADLVLNPSVVRNGDRVRLIYSVWNVETRFQEAGDTIDGSPSDLFGMQDELCERVATALKRPLPARRTPRPGGLETASQQQRYTLALGNLQRSDRKASVEEAAKLLEELGGEAPSSPLPPAALARADLSLYLLTKDKAWAEKAQKNAERARELDPELPETHVTLGELWTRTGRAAEAIPELQKALRVQPNQMDALLGLAAAYHFAGQDVEAEAACRRAMALQPGYWASYNLLGGFYYRRGNYSAAAQMFERVVQLTPDNLRGYNNLGGAYQQADQFDKARQAYLASIRVKPSDGAYSNLGSLEFLLGRYRESAEAFENAIKLTPGKSLYWRNLGDACRWTPDQKARAADAYRKAVTLAEQALSVNNKDVSEHLTVAVSQAKLGDVTKSRAALARALELSPADPNTFYQAAVVANLEGKPDDALRWIAKAREKGLGKQQFERDPELQNLRKLPAFQEAINAPKGKT
ncbi:MAG TPA: protein kinase [Thermoanaerobaculia bacterium]|nr:protein kinase [Thermoanaerobaculia bacterium]